MALRTLKHFDDEAPCAGHEETCNLALNDDNTTIKLPWGKPALIKARTVVTTAY